MTVANMYVPQQGTLSDLRSWIAGELGAAVARLYVSNTPYNTTNTPASYTEASFAGYTPIGGIAWTPPFINGAGKAETDGNALTWTFTGGSGSETCFGIILTDLAKTKLLVVVPFTIQVELTPTQPSTTWIPQVVQASEL